MNLENELLEKFQVEELEKRYEMSFWTPQKTEHGIRFSTDEPEPEPKPKPDPCEDDPTCDGMFHWVTPEEKAAQKAAGG